MFVNPIEPSAFNELGSNPFYVPTSTVTPNPRSVYNPVPGVTYTPPTFGTGTWGTNSGGSGSGSNVWGNILNTATNQSKFDQIIALISQGISGIAPRPNTQIYAGYGTVQTAQQPYQTYGSYGLPQNQFLSAQTQQYPYPTGGVGQSAVNTATGFFDGIAASFGISPTMLFLGLGVGAYLLMREPPRGRR